MTENESRLAAAALEPPSRTTLLQTVSSNPLVLAIVGFVLTGLIGYKITAWHDDNVRQRERDNALRDYRMRESRELAERMYDRLTASTLLSSAIIRSAPRAEFETRRAYYDSAYVRWNRGLWAFASVREISGALEYSEFEARLYALHDYFHAIDEALTIAADSFNRNPKYAAAYIRARPGDTIAEWCVTSASTLLSQRCRIKALMDRANFCIAGLVTGLSIFAATAKDTLSADSVGLDLHTAKTAMDTAKQRTHAALAATSGARQRVFLDLEKRCPLSSELASLPTGLPGVPLNPPE